MTTTPTAERARTGLIAAVVAGVVVVIAAIAVIVLVTRDDSSHVTVPPLTQAQRQAGVLRVSYPDRRLPDEPTVATVGGQRVTLYFESAHGTGDEAQAVLRVGVGDAQPSQVTLTTGGSTTVAGVEVGLVAAYDTGDLATDAADVTVTAP